MKKIYYRVLTFISTLIILGAYINLNADDKKQTKTYEDVVAKCEKIKSDKSKAESKVQLKYKVMLKTHKLQCTNLYIKKCQESYKGKKMTKEERKDAKDSCKSSAESTCSSCNG